MVNVAAFSLLSKPVTRRNHLTKPRTEAPMQHKTVSLILLERAVKSQFFLLRHGDKGKIKRQRHRLECHHVEIKNPGLALFVFVGMALDYRHDVEEISIYLGLDEKLVVRYGNSYTWEFQTALMMKNAGVRLNPESSAGKVYIKTALVKNWLKWNS